METVEELIKRITVTMGMPQSVEDRAIEFYHSTLYFENTSASASAASSIAIAVLALELKESYPIYKIAQCIEIAPSVICKRIQSIFRTKSGIFSIKQLSSRIPKLYDRLIAANRKKLALSHIQDNIRECILRVTHDMHMPHEVCGRAIGFLKANFSIISMTTLEVAAGACIALAVLSLRLRSVYHIVTIARYLKISGSSITSRIYKVLSFRNISARYHIYELESLIPEMYPVLMGRLTPISDIVKAKEASIV
jgi:transcription initiation factor TFIIIB Brf1 subunit/transcription initiation factor TFIIB